MDSIFFFLSGKAKVHFMVNGFSFDKIWYYSQTSPHTYRWGNWGINENLINLLKIAQNSQDSIPGKQTPKSTLLIHFYPVRLIL